MDENKGYRQSDPICRISFFPVWNHVKALTGFEDTYKNTENGEEVEKENTPKSVSFKVTVNGEQITRNNETVKENETAKTVNVSGQGTIEIKVTIDGATKSYTMDLDKTTSLSIP